MSLPVSIRRVGRESGLSEALANVLMDAVESGASVGFLRPLSRDRAVCFWEGVLDSVERGERILLIAEEEPSRRIVGTVQLIVAMPDNQPHRADVAKMQVHRTARRQGVGAALMRAVESAALEVGRTVLVLDTVTDSDAFRLYQKLGWQRCGEIPNYALWPGGGFCNTTYFYRLLDQSAQA